ncbi:40S ribosomal protein S21-2-like protein [Tanacetum coccineum]
MLANGENKKQAATDGVRINLKVKSQNEQGWNMDLYILSWCSATNRLIATKDHASVQISVGHLYESARCPVPYFCSLWFCARCVIFLNDMLYHLCISIVLIPTRLLRDDGKKIEKDDGDANSVDNLSGQSGVSRMIDLLEKFCY